MKTKVLVCAAIALTITACAPDEAAETIERQQTLAVEGRANATPSIAAEGTFVAVAWGATAGDRVRVVVATSRDGGRTFGAPVGVTGSETARLGGEFPPRVAVRRGATDFEVSVVWTAGRQTPEIRASRSTDGGRTFGDPRMLQADEAPGMRGWPAAALDTAGAAHVVWLDHRGLAAEGGGHAHATSASVPAEDGAVRALKSGLYYASAEAGERELASGVCYCCKTALATGPNGAVYAAWRHVYPGNLRDIAFIASRDGGATFESPVRVSEDGWQIDGCPDDGPAMAVDGDGTVHIVWPSVIQTDQPRGAIFYASSRDGRTFSPRVEVPSLGSVKPAHPQIAIDRSGRIIVAWDEQSEGRRVAAVREIRRSAGGDVAFGEVMSLADSPAAYYPVLAAVDDGFVAAWSNAGETPTIGVRRFTPH